MGNMDILFTVFSFKLSSYNNSILRRISIRAGLRRDLIHLNIFQVQVRSYKYSNKAKGQN